MKKMRKKRTTKNKLVLLIFYFFSLLLFTPHIATAAMDDYPGSYSDPLITKAWLETYVQECFEPVIKRIDQLEQKLGGFVNIVLTIAKSEAEVNGKITAIPAPPQIMGAGYTMVPARFIGEALGLSVDWDAAERKVTFSGQGQNVTLTINQNTASINGHTYTMPMAPLISGGYTLVHVRFISEAFHCKVEWQEKTRQVFISK